MRRDFSVVGCLRSGLSFPGGAGEIGRAVLSPPALFAGRKPRAVKARPGPAALAHAIPHSQRLAAVRADVLRKDFLPLLAPHGRPVLICECGLAAGTLEKIVARSVGFARPSEALELRAAVQAVDVRIPLQRTPPIVGQKNGFVVGMQVVSAALPVDIPVFRAPEEGLAADRAGKDLAAGAY